MKKFRFYLLGAMIAAMIVSCTQEEDLSNTVDNSSRNEIKFSTAVPVTRANVKTSSNWEDNDSLGVYSYTKTGELSADFTIAPTNLFNNTKLYYTLSTTLWKYDGIRYWIKGENAKTSFLAYHPYINPLAPPTKNLMGAPSVNGSYIEFNYEVPLTLSEQADFLYAVLKNVDNSTATGNQTLAFNHALGLTEYTVKTKATYDNATIKVTKFEVINLNNKGTFYLDRNLVPSTNQLAGKAWALTEEENNYTVFSGEQTLTTTAELLGTEANKLFIIPRGGGDDNVAFRISYNVEYTDGTPTQNNVVTVPKILNISRGSLYRYEIRVGLNEITFDVTVANMNTSSGGIATAE